MIQEFLGLDISFPGSLFVLFGLSTVAYFHGGWPFLKGAVKEIRTAAPGMMTLIAVAITVAYAYSSAVVFGLEGKLFFWELVTLIDIMLLGHWIEMRSVLGASKALQMLVSLMPAEAHVMENGSVRRHPPGRAEERRAHPGEARRKGPCGWRDRQGREQLEREHAHRRIHSGEEGEG